MNDLALVKVIRTHVLAMEETSRQADDRADCRGWYEGYETACDELDRVLATLEAALTATVS